MSEERESGTEPSFSVPAEVVKNYPAGSCEFTDVPPSLTVGDKWMLKCKDLASLKLPLLVQFPDEKMAYGLVVLGEKNDGSDNRQFLVTSYKPGDYSPPYIVLTDGQSAVRVDNLRWQIGAVVEAKEGQKPEPVPPFGPFYLSLPWWYYAAWAGLFLFICLVGFFFWRWRRRVRRERERLKKLENSLTPYLELHRDLRRLTRERIEATAVCETLAKALRIYLSRRTKILLLDTKSVALVKSLKGRYSKELLVELRDLLRELDRGLKSAGSLSLSDCEQLITMARTLVDRLDTHR